MKNLILIFTIFLFINANSQSLSNNNFKNIYKKPSNKIYTELISEGFIKYKDTSNVFFKYLQDNTNDDIELFVKKGKYVYILQSSNIWDYVRTTEVLDNLLLSIDEDTRYRIFSHKLQKYLGYHIYDDEKQVCLINKY